MSGDIRPWYADGGSSAGAKAELFELFFGESTGRMRAPVGGLPAGVMAVTIPVRRDGEARAPRDRRHRLRIRDVELISSQPVQAFDPPPDMARRELVFVLGGGRRDWSTIEAFFGPERAWKAAISLVRCGGVALRCCTDENLQLARPVSWRRSHAWSLQHADLLNDLRGRRDPDQVRSDLLDMMAEADTLSAERDLLAAVHPGSPLRVPEGSAAGTEAWSVYEHAVRAAVVWWMHRVSGAEPLTAKALASKAFRNSKGWTPERELAFASLTGTSFDHAVSQADTDLRIRGPLVWQVGRVAADAAVAEPWVAVPASGVRAAGIIRCDAVGVLLVENSDTFEQVCMRQSITQQWLCVWGKGQISDGVAALLSFLAPRPVAAWCDLDADGISIVNVLSRKLGRPVYPVGMDVGLWRSGPHRIQTQSQIDRDKSLAAKLAATGPESLRPLAREIATAGGSCEQEAIQDQVLPSLATALTVLSASSRPAAGVPLHGPAGAEVNSSAGQPSSSSH